MLNIDKKLFLQHAENIISVTSGLGSMGKTWLSITLAHALNQLSNSVLLFDADNGVLNAESQLGLSEKSSLNRVLSDEITLNQAVVPVNRKKFDILTGRAGSTLFEDVPDGKMQILREDLMIFANNYDYMIFDIPYSERILQHLLPKDTSLLLVCTNDPANLVETYNFLKDVGKFNQYKSLQIVVNYANSYEEGIQTYNTIHRACERYIKVMPKLLGVVRRDTRVRDAIRNHTLLLNRYPDSEAAEDIMFIARKLLNMEKDNEQ